jgi:thioredoxin-like negative regulator of GroEL
VNNRVLELKEANFNQEVLSAANPVLVLYWAGWSDSYKAIVPILESV